MMSGSYYDVTNLSEFDQLMYLPLYTFGEGNKPELDSSLSIAEPAKFSDNNTVVSITLKHWRWSDGTPITARDVVFWLNLMSAVTDPNAPTVGSNSAPGPGWAGTDPTGIPNNIVSYHETGTYSLQLKLNASYNPTWYQYNQLSQISPLPQQAWDKLSAGSAVGNYDAGAEARKAVPDSSPVLYVTADPGTADSGALGVAQFLNEQSQSLSTYATNPLWKIVDGPFRLSAFTESGFAKFVPNALYSGAPKPSVGSFEELPFTSDTAEFLALRSGALTIGYLPTQDLGQRGTLEHSEGYSFSPWWNFSFNYFSYNFTNPAVGSVFKELYFRQAFQSLINQPEYIHSFMSGIGSVESGPVPTYPPHNSYESPLEAGPAVYPYSPAAAVSLLRKNGWTVVPEGVSYCARPGVASGECGAGIAKGQKLVFTMLTASGSTEISLETQAMASTMRRAAGIELVLSSQPLGQVIGTAFAGCTYAAPCSNWQFAVWGPSSYSGLPTGGALFSPGPSSGAADYTNAEADRLIDLTHTAPSAAAEIRALYAYQDYLAKQLPVVYMPNGPTQFTLYKSGLRGLVPQGIYGAIFPQEYKLG